MNSCIVLAAGFSSRFQSIKALAYLNREIVIERLQRTLLNTNLDEIVIVLGHAQELIKPHLLKHSRIKVVYNKDYNFGQTSSFKVGLSSVSEKSKGTFLIPVDYPCIKTETVDFLINAVSLESFHKTILIPIFRGKKGHPPYFTSSLFKEFLMLGNDEGLNSISHRHADQVELINVDDSGIIQTFNTVEELEAIKRSFQE